MKTLKLKVILLIFITVLSGSVAAYNLWNNTWNGHSRVPNFEKIQDTESRKIAFFNYLLPIVEKENNKIKIIRSLIQNNQFSSQQIAKLAKKYRLENPDKQALLAAIDIIPSSLVLAQAAIESNWGRSRFSQRWHNYFGIWCFKPGCGIVPKNRDKNAKHEVAQFSSTAKAVEYYLLNLNRNNAYILLRQIRSYKRSNSLIPKGRSLAEGLENYSGIGYEYIELVQGIIRQNELGRFD
ncbi:MAG: hypothetical protein HAW58_02565 [Candidatus Thioglobus sp.]|nr:hypothetical protein [Candidatus Thioglobus sp.]